MPRVFNSEFALVLGTLLFPLPCVSTAAEMSKESLSNAVNQASLIVAGHIKPRFSGRHSEVEIVHPAVIWGKFDTNKAKALVIKYSRSALTWGIQPEGAWLIFLSSAEPTTGTDEIHRLIGNGWDYEGMVEGTQENITLVRTLLRKRVAQGHAPGSGEQVPNRSLGDILARLQKQDATQEEISSALRQLQSFGPKARASLPILSGLLQAENPNPDLLRTLKAIGPEAASVMLIGLTNRSGEERSAFAAELGKFGPPARVAVPGLVQALEDSFFLVRVYAAISLGLIHEEPALTVPALARKLKDEDPTVRQEAARALGAFGPAAKTAIPALETEIAAGSNSAASNALRRINSP